MTTKHKLRLTYFDFHGGRAEPARLALAYGGIEFEDNRIPPKEWPALKPTTPFGSMPLLEVDGQMVTQSNGINRFAGKLSGLYPDDPWQALLCDEIMDAVEDVMHKVVATFPMSDPERKEAREKLCAGPITHYLTRFSTMLSERGDFFADNRLTVADLKVFVWCRSLSSGILDHIPTDLVGTVAPRIAQHHERVKNEPKIKAYYDSFAS